MRLLSFAFRDSANGGYLKSGFSPAPCSPLRRLRAYSAELVRAPPYIKVERENCPPAAIWLYSHRFIGRARHKLKRARQLRRIYRGFCIRIVHARRAAFIHVRRYAVLSRRSLFRIPNSAFRIPHSEFLIPHSPPLLHKKRRGVAVPSFLLSSDYYLSSFLYSARSFTAASCLPVFSRRSR